MDTTELVYGWEINLVEELRIKYVTKFRHCTAASEK
jgi:hypothetical protein